MYVYVLPSSLTSGGILSSNAPKTAHTTNGERKINKKGKCEQWNATSTQKLFEIVWNIAAEFYQEKDYDGATIWLSRYLFF